MMRKVFSIAAVVLSLASAVSCSRTSPLQHLKSLRKPLASEPPVVSVITVEPVADAEGAPAYVGTAEPSRSTVICNRIPGTLVNLQVEKGRKVCKGDLIAEVSSEMARSSYGIAEATLKQARDGYERVSKLYAGGSVTEVKMMDIETQLRKAEAAERSARQVLDECRITAPFDGIVGDVYAHCGESLLAAAPLVQIIDAQDVEIHFSVPESEYSLIRTGCGAEVEVPALGRTFTAVVAVKGVTASVLSHSYDFTLKNLKGASGLVPGMVCKVRVRMPRTGGETLFVIPASAVLTDAGGRYVWGVDSDDLVCKKYVSTGGFAGRGIVVSGGLDEGERVIVEGSRKVSTGMKVKAVAK